MNNLYVDLIAYDEDDFNSESVDIVGYDRASKTLYIEFQSSGDVYSYQGVEESTYNLLVTAPSVGRFVANHIKGNGYGGEKYDDDHYIVKREDNDATTTQAEAFPRENVTEQFVAALPDREEKSETTVQAGIHIKNEDSEFFVPNARISVPEGVKSRYAVQWTIPGTAISGEPVYLAGNEFEALEDFAKDVETLLGGGVEVKVKAVVHYFD